MKKLLSHVNAYVRLDAQTNMASLGVASPNMMTRFELIPFITFDEIMVNIYTNNCNFEIYENDLNKQKYKNKA